MKFCVSINLVLFSEVNSEIYQEGSSSRYSGWISERGGQTAAPPGLPRVPGEGGHAGLHEGHYQESFGGVFYFLASKC